MTSAGRGGDGGGARDIACLLAVETRRITSSQGTSKACLAMVLAEVFTATSGFSTLLHCTRTLSIYEAYNLLIYYKYILLSSSLTACPVRSSVSLGR